MLWRGTRMPDVVVCVPKRLWIAWLAEGTLAGEPCPIDIEYHWFGGSTMPQIAQGERVYIAAHGRLRGYAPLVRLETRAEALKRWCAQKNPALPAPALWWWPYAKWALVRHGSAMAVTIPEPIRGIPGWRYRFWQREDERPFPDWRELTAAPQQPFPKTREGECRGS